MHIYIYLHTPSKGIYSTNFYQLQSFQILLANTRSHESVHTHVMQWQLLYMWPDKASQHEAAMVSPCTGRRPYTKLASIIYICALTGGPLLHVYVARARQRLHGLHVWWAQNTKQGFMRWDSWSICLLIIIKLTLKRCRDELIISPRCPYIAELHNESAQIGTMHSTNMPAHYIG